MRKRETTRRRAAVLAVALAAALTMLPAWSGGGVAWAADEEEDVPLDTKLLRQFLKDLGLQRDGSGIEYRERAPLVVPPNRNLLPPPQSEAAITSNPAWPKDPDVKQRSIDAVKRKQPNRTAAEAMEADARPLSRSELERGRIAAGSTPSSSPTPEQSARPMQPSELGGKNIFSNMFSSFKNEGETATFSGEPPRTSLTEPPPGYMTPSPNQRYGLGPATNQSKPITLEDRVAGPTR
jgi:hypothetical protein